MTPQQALQILKEGNERFISGKTLKHCLMTQVRETAAGQLPFAAVLGCSDSRVPPELIFDQAIGDIFCVRIAGNFANTDIIGSMELATKSLGAKLILVLGHTECGAIKAACDDTKLENLSRILSSIAPALHAVEDIRDHRTSANKAFVRRVTHENVRLTVQALTDRSATLKDLAASKRIQIVAAVYDVANGRVSFFA